MSRNRYPCAGELFDSQIDADVQRDVITAQTRERHELYVYVCVDGHWHVRRADQ